MATKTNNLNLTKPAQEDFYNVDDFNENFQKIDDFVGAAGFLKNSFAEDANKITSTGFYYANVNTPDNTWCYINHYQYPTSGYALQSAYSIDAKFHCIRRCQSGVWGEWEYENPPMVAGVEYRTTERFFGRPVYTKLLTLYEEEIYGELDETYLEQYTALISVDGCYITSGINMGQTNTIPLAAGDVTIKINSGGYLQILPPSNGSSILEMSLIVKFVKYDD